MSVQMPRGSISVVITTYNDGPMLGEALRSVAEQTLSPREILVIDDGSEPATAPAIVDAFRCETGLAVEYVWQKNAGPSAARNTGLRRARQEFIAYLDADDRWLPQHLERKWTRLSERSADYSTAYNGFAEFDHATGRSLPTIATGDHDGPIAAALLGVPGGVPAGMPFQLHRRDVLVGVGGFDEDLREHEDFDLLLRMGRAGYQITGTGERTVMRRVHPRSLTRVDPERTLKDLERFLHKAARESLLSQKEIASKRKWARLSLGKQQVAEARTARKGVETLRQAFEHDTPTGMHQWATFCAVRSRPLASLVFAAYRLLRDARGVHG
jgi:glycosyltransferase involved in cell wall biosynthesis